MPRDDVIEVEGTVIEVLPHNMARVELANGHRLWARMSGRPRESLAGLAPADMVAVQMSPFDLSRGRIIERINILRK